jgi:hypothetical protein
VIVKGPGFKSPYVHTKKFNFLDSVFDRAAFLFDQKALQYGTGLPRQVVSRDGRDMDWQSDQSPKMDGTECSEHT